MARRGFGGTALRAALGAVTGVAEGLQQRDILAAQKQREKDLMARQQAMDLAGLLSQGFEPVADVQRKQQAATGAAGSLIASALNAASMPFAGSAAGLPSAESQKLLSQGYAAAKPERTIDYGGQQLALRETGTERQDRLAREQEMRQQRRTEDAANLSVQARKSEQARLDALASDALKGGAKSPSALRLALESPTAYKAIFEDPNAITPYQQAQLKISQQRLNLDKAQAEKAGGAVASTGSAGLDYTADLKKINEFLPSVDSKTGKVIPPQRELSGTKLLTVQQGGLGGSTVGQLGTLGASMAGADLGNEQIYNTTASGIATAFAIQEQRGRNVSDRDVKNRIEQVTLTPTEVGNLEVQALKANRLRQWINALSSNKVPQVNPGETSIPPAIGTPASGGFPSYEEWAKARKK